MRAGVDRRRAGADDPGPHAVQVGQQGQPAVVLNHQRRVGGAQRRVARDRQPAAAHPRAAGVQIGAGQGQGAKADHAHLTGPGDHAGEVAVLVVDQRQRTAAMLQAPAALEAAQARFVRRTGVEHRSGGNRYRPAGLQCVAPREAQGPFGKLGRPGVGLHPAQRQRSGPELAQPARARDDMRPGGIAGLREADPAVVDDVGGQAERIALQHPAPHQRRRMPDVGAGQP